MLKSQSKIKAGGQIILIPQSEIKPNPNQPRRHFDYDELESLAQSIRENGIIQPISVRQLKDNTYELVAGERRLRAARMVGLARIPCILMKIDDGKSALYGLIENLQRQDLDFFEEALAIEKLMKEYNMSQEEASKNLGKAQSTLSNKLRLLKLTEQQRIKISAARLTERHARALLSLKDELQIDRALSIIVDRHLNVQETDKLIKQILNRQEGGKRPTIKLFKDVRIFINTLNHAVDTMRKAGIDADSVKSETDEYIEYVVRIPKAGDIVVKPGGKHTA